jgi:2-polyprenyl-3-methyl-5-hydroxy-6-metoxy-1,4-benzoquinol methylase
MPDETVLAGLYDRSWERPNYNTTETGSTDTYIARKLISLLARTLGRRGIAGMRILDYGAGRGAMAGALITEGADVMAVEPFGYGFLRELGVSAYSDLSLVPSDVRFDGIVCLEVIEHLCDPCRVLKSLYKRLSPGGWLLITTPNAAGLPARLAGQHWREATKPGHIVFFTPQTLRNILRDAGFRHIRRPRWFIRYPNTSPLRTLAHFGLQKLGIDGGLRMIAYRP